MLVGRKNEREALESLYGSNKAELVALYGRRRVGKTYLVDETFGNRITFRHAGLSPIDDRYSSESKRKSRMKDQLRHFHHSLLMQGMQKSRVPETWLDAFYMLEQFLLEKAQEGGRLLVFLDEIQWLDSPRSGFMTGFEAFWNGWACHRHDIMVIVCGSSSSWVLDKLVNNHGGMYGRITYQIKLAPFTLHECEEFLAGENVIMSRYDKTLAYMAVGGVPYYLRYFKKGLSLSQNIDSLFFVENAPLRDEFDVLFSSLFANPDNMKAVVVALSSKASGLTRQELIDKTGIPNSGDFSAMLKSLEVGNFIMRYHSFGSSKRETLFKLVDPFCLFWLRFVKGSMDKHVSWTNMIDTGAVAAWRGYAFENLCWTHVRQIKAALGIGGVVTSESMWSKRGDDDGRGTQVDLIISRKDNVVNMCEAKFVADEFSVDKEYHFVLVRRRQMMADLIPRRAVVHSVLITTYGLKYNEYSSDFVHTITLDDLFSA